MISPDISASDRNVYVIKEIINQNSNQLIDDRMISPEEETISKRAEQRVDEEEIISKQIEQQFDDDKITKQKKFNKFTLSALISSLLAISFLTALLYLKLNSIQIPALLNTILISSFFAGVTLFVFFTIINICHNRLSQQNTGFTPNIQVVN
jgi:hypothetical protein